MMWNMNGHLALKIRSEKVMDMIKDNNILILQETWLCRGQEDTLPLPAGYTMVAMTRPFRSRARLPGGGVSVIMKSNIKYSVCKRLSHPDMLVLDLDCFYLICSYLVPVGSDWRKWTKVDPCEKLAEAIAFCSSNYDKPLLIMGDLNLRTAS